MSDYTQSHRKYLLSSQSSSIYGALYKPFDMVCLEETALTVCSIQGYIS